MSTFCSCFAHCCLTFGTEAVLTAKHGCGFLLWNTSTTLPNGDPYTYHVPAEYDVLRQFSDTMKAEGLGHGFYYSLTNNMCLLRGIL